MMIGAIFPLGEIYQPMVGKRLLGAVMYACYALLPLGPLEERAHDTQTHTEHMTGQGT